MIKSVCSIIFFLLSLAFRSLAEAETRSPEDILIGSAQIIVLEASRGSEVGEVVSERIVNTYDLQGRVIEAKHVEYGDDDHGSEHHSRSAKIYDADGKRKELVFYREDGTISGRKVTFTDDKGNSIEDIEYGPDGSRGMRYVYRRDDNGNRVEAITYQSDESILAREVYANSYDEQGNLKKWVYDRWDSRKDSERLWINDHYKMIYTYDEKGRVSKSLIYDMDDSLWEKLKYALFGKRNYSLKYKHHYVYYPNGYRSESTSYDGGGVMQSKSNYVYEFDSVGNWIKKTEQRWVYKEGRLETEPSDITNRTITYNTK